jgi:hypothetical protein
MVITHMHITGNTTRGSRRREKRTMTMEEKQKKTEKWLF